MTDALHVLIVEDNLINQRVLSLMLETLSYTCEIAGSGEEGVSLALSKPFDIVLMDIGLPQMDGIAATQKIRIQKNANLLPVIALTGHAQADKGGDSHALGIDAWLMKPIDKGILQKTIQSVTLNKH